MAHTHQLMWFSQQPHGGEAVPGNVICLRRLGQDPSSRTLGGLKRKQGQAKALQGCSS